jgi:hypothetical protein
VTFVIVEAIAYVGCELILVHTGCITRVRSNIAPAVTVIAIGPEMGVLVPILSCVLKVTETVGVEP